MRLAVDRTGALEQVLVAAARRLRRLIRDDDIVGRLGDQDFAVLLHDMTDLPTVETVTERICDSLNRPFRIKSGIAPVRASIGVAISPPDTPADHAIERAERAMKRTDSEGGGVSLAASEPQPAAGDAGPLAAARVDLSGDLRTLLHDDVSDDRLAFRYCPIVRLPEAGTDVATVSHVAATVSWRHPAHGELVQRELFDAGAASGLLTPLMAQLMTVAARQAAAWSSSGDPLVVTLPAPASCLSDPWFVPALQTAVESARCDPGLLRLEFPQARVMAHPGMTVPALEAIRRLGTGIVISGFGSGESSIASLDRIPVDELMIPCDGLTENSTAADRSQVRQAIASATALHVPCVATGIPSLTGIAVVRDAGCGYVLGPAVSEAVPAEVLPRACAQARQRVLNTLLRAAPFASGHPASGHPASESPGPYPR